jgi:hypothetical protein
MERKKSTRQIGDDLEKKTKILLKSSFEFTAGSGSVWKDGDLRHKEYVVECKVKNATKGISVPAKDLAKLQEEAKKQLKEWLFVVENAKGDISITMDIRTFSEILYQSELWDEHSKTQYDEI